MKTELDIKVTHEGEDYAYVELDGIQYEIDLKSAHTILGLIKLIIDILKK